MAKYRRTFISPASSRLMNPPSPLTSLVTVFFHREGEGGMGGERKEKEEKNGQTDRVRGTLAGREIFYLADYRKERIKGGMKKRRELSEKARKGGRKGVSFLSSSLVFFLHSS